MKYRKKPVVIEAVQFIKGQISIKDIQKSLGLGISQLVPIKFKPDGVFIETLEGDMLVSDGDYIIKGVKGEFYPCKPDIFLATYDLVD